MNISLKYGMTVVFAEKNKFSGKTKTSFQQIQTTLHDFLRTYEHVIMSINIRWTLAFLSLILLSFQWSLKNK